MLQRSSIWKTLFLPLVFVLSICSCVSSFAQLSGTYTVGVGGDFPSIDSAFQKLSMDGVAGAVTFTLTDTAYVAPGKPLKNLRPATPRHAIIGGEREELSLPSAYEFDLPTDGIPALTLAGPIVGASATNRITFRPAAGRAVKIVGNGAWVIRLLDASYFTFDGINSGGTSLRLQAIAGNGLQIEGNSDNVIVQDTQIGTPSFSAILLQSAANGIPDSTLVQRNTVDSYSFNGFFGVNLAVGTGVSRGLRLSNNNFGTATDSIAQAGIVVQHTDGAWINNNTVRHLRRAGDTFGIGAITRHFRTRIWNNKIFDVRLHGTTGGILRGIRLFGTLGDTTRSAIYNNMIFDLDYASTGTATGSSIRSIQHTDLILDTIAYNSIWLTGASIASVPNA
ncbi:MAG: hypothetical protein HY961_00825, partial [Ignavibacteriae bacterium]|nr:hypothetical protein [Ignavibacteriota bacterium]